jgi:hypothetical protein
MPDQASTSPQRRVPASALSAIVDAFDGDPDEITSYLNVETGEVIPVFDDARSDLETVRALLPADFDDGTLDEQRAALADAIENADYLSSEPIQIEEAFLVEQGLGTTSIEVPRMTPAAGHLMMEAFVETVRAPQVRDRLANAIRGRGAFRRVRDALRQESDELDRWYAFKQEWLTERARRWLDSEDIEVADA